MKAPFLSLLLILTFASCNSNDCLVAITPQAVPFSLVKCLDGRSAGRNVVVNSQSAYDSIVGVGICGDSAINFKLYTLIGLNAYSGGCGWPFLPSSGY